MAQAKKKTATRTAKKTTARKAQCRKKVCNRTQRKDITNQERMHVYIITGMSIIAGILLCANAAMMMV
ncbi:hypothetical protein IKG29_03195 [Candidatus Saccharibacteria bacterium]|nr:hypothetical protein [Candidatus Saccharibacteria bacterium]MBR3329502.1 hypothetical protein [Candidatus Saccharibacteria bacterium]